MPTTTHTAGPWDLSPIKGGDRVGVFAGGSLVAEVVQPGRDWSDETDTHARCDAERAANARLIVTAPVLLEALREFARTWVAHRHPLILVAHLGRVVDVAKRAIAKTEGEG